PIAKIAAKLAIGYTLDELMNDITATTPASFEPTIDYVVTKIPRFAFEKFPGAEPLLSTAMKSVGETMAIGRNFCESLQKALRSLETGLDGLNTPDNAPTTQAAMRQALTQPTPDRLLLIAEALRLGLAVEEICAITKYSEWFVRQLETLIQTEAQISRDGLPDDAETLRHLKSLGFSDSRLAHLTTQEEGAVRALRHKLKVHPFYRHIDSCAAEFAASTPYLYSAYDTPLFLEQDEAPPSDKRKAVILGGGPNRIGQGIEFDYCCCHAAFALDEAGIESIMINCNPETVSTDYDTSDRLYFEPLTQEDVLEILRREQSHGTLLGVIVQFGGQTPLKLATALEAAGIPILGTSPDAIDLAEDRDRFKTMAEQLQLKQPPNGIARSAKEAHAIALDIGFPVVIRPSYVLGGRAMEIVRNEKSLMRYIKEAVIVSGNSPVLIDGYLHDATELDVDVLCDGETACIAGLLEHIEEAGVHSGDSACSMPPHSLSPSIIAAVEAEALSMAKAFNVVGLMNVQFAIQNETIYVIEANPRASRTVPFVAKVLGLPIAHIATRIMTGTSLADYTPQIKTARAALKNHIAVKESVFPFARFANVDTVLGPEMRSTGEVMGHDKDFATAFLKSQLAAGVHLPTQGGGAFISVRDGDKPRATQIAQSLITQGFTIIATGGTADYLRSQGLAITTINKVLEGSPHIVDALQAGDIALLINTTEGEQSLADSKSIRRTALMQKTPYFTTMAGAEAASKAIDSAKNQSLSVISLQEYIIKSP
ncbi:MAG: carbamoyl-phosphate synthase large subunit, partial [Alphaproteobacteria bacterium]|nr:carbamoyl-phosphate synthase large subunit [Alphaproteobacteria bacterium]